MRSVSITTGIIHGLVDVRKMQKLVQDAWRVAGPRVEWHVGDVAWGRWHHAGREREWKVELWDGAWTWLRLPANELDWLVHPERKGSDLHARLLEWFEEEAEGEGPLRTWSFADDEATLAVLAAAGFSPEANGKPMSFNARELGGEAERRLPDGFRFRTVSEDDLARRVEVHRLVWHPSRVTEESYANVMRAWPYRTDLDCVVEAPDGRLAAYALAWYDNANRVGELEPVGTHPDFRRRGLGAAVCRYAFGRLRDAGAEQVVVYSNAEPAQQLYESLGFRRHSLLVPFTKVR
jgi:ribosomal protein S18 acetylase RimI-like enzyme